MLTAREFEKIKKKLEAMEWVAENGYLEVETMLKVVGKYVEEADADSDERTRFDPDDDIEARFRLYEAIRQNTEAIKEQSRMYDLFVTKLFDRLERNREQLAPTIVEAIKVAVADLREP